MPLYAAKDKTMAREIKASKHLPEGIKKPPAQAGRRFE